MLNAEPVNQHPITFSALIPMAGLQKEHLAGICETEFLQAGDVLPVTQPSVLKN